MKILILSLLLIPTLCLAIPEDRFVDVWSDEALPYFETMTKGELKNKQGLSIRYYSLSKNAAKSLVIVPGRTEPSMKYAELIYDLRNADVNIFILDHQGQGESDRILADSHKGYVVSFQDYVDDLELFMNKVVLKKNKELYLLAHSMGGAISAHYLARNPSVFNRAVLMAPMLELNTEPYKEIVARIYARVLVTIGKGTEYAPDRGPYIPEEDRFETNPYTHSELRFEASKFLFVNFPDLALGGPTARWVSESLKATKKIHKLKIKTPVLMYQSGLDEIVKPKRQNLFCRPEFCTKKLVTDGKHELLMEKDEIRDQILKEIKSFLGI